MGDRASNEVPVVLMLGEKFSGLPSEQYTRVLAEAGASASRAGRTRAQSRALLLGRMRRASLGDCVIVKTPLGLMLRRSGFDQLFSQVAGQLPPGQFAQGRTLRAAALGGQRATGGKHAARWRI